jgi:hypothetical protein
MQAEPKPLLIQEDISTTYTYRKKIRDFYKLSHPTGITPIFELPTQG